MQMLERKRFVVESEQDRPYLETHLVYTFETIILHLYTLEAFYP